MKKLLYIIPFVLIACAAPQPRQSSARNTAGEYGDLGLIPPQIFTLEASMSVVFSKSNSDFKMYKAKGPCNDSTLCEIGIGYSVSKSKLIVTDSTRKKTIAEIPVIQAYDLEYERDVDNHVQRNCLKITKHPIKAHWLGLDSSGIQYPAKQISELKPLVENISKISRAGTPGTAIAIGFVLVAENRQVFEYSLNNVSYLANPPYCSGADR